MKIACLCEECGKFTPVVSIDFECKCGNAGGLMNDNGSYPDPEVKVSSEEKS